MPRLQIMSGAAVVVVGVRHRADDGVFVRDLGQTPQVLADEQVRRAAFDGLERPAHLTLRVRLHVKGLELARPTKQEQKDHRLRLSTHESLLRLLRGENARQGHPEQACSANLQQLTARDAGAVGARCAVDGKHGVMGYDP